MNADDKMFYVIAYDISEDKRRNKVFGTLQGFGRWTQYSLFECWLTKKQLLVLQSRLQRYLDARVDSVRFYPLCVMDVSRVETVGGEKPREDKVYVV